MRIFYERELPTLTLVTFYKYPIIYQDNNLFYLLTGTNGSSKVFIGAFSSLEEVFLWIQSDPSIEEYYEHEKEEHYIKEKSSTVDQSLELIKQIKKENPYLRLTQIIHNCFLGSSIYYYTDEQFLECLIKYKKDIQKYKK